MANNVVAYVGLESFDIILYLSRILQRLGRRVLVVDHSETLALTYSVPQIQGMNALVTTISNRRVDFTGMQLTSELAEGYDDILIDCGISNPETSAWLLTKIIYVTDMFEYNIRRIAQIGYYKACECETTLLIRNVSSTKIAVEHIAKKLDMAIPAEKISIIYREEEDYENSLNSHINQVFTLNLSMMLKEYLVEQVNSLCPQFSRSDIKGAYKKARKGD